MTSLLTVLRLKLKPVFLQLPGDNNSLMRESINDVENKYDGSEAVVFFTVSNISKLSIEQLIVEGLSNFDYNKYAENCMI